MKKLQKVVPLFLLMCLFSLAAGCGSDKDKTDPEDMAGNTVTESRPNDGSMANGNDTASETEAFDGSKTDEGSLNNSVTDPTANEMEESASTATDTGNAMEDAADTAGDLAKDAGNAIDDAGHAVKDAVDDVGNGVRDIADDVTKAAP